MKFFEYLYYRMYAAYTKKNDSPVMRTFMYVSLVIYLILAVLIIYLDQILTVCNVLSEETSKEIRRSKVFWGVYILFTLLFTYFRFTRKDFSYYEKKYSKCYSLNKSVKIWMLVAFPFLFFFLSIFLMAPLFGGTILGKEFTGILKH
ncbi:MAG: hypothetical protein QM640_04425 [Niabella sp.]